MYEEPFERHCSKWCRMDIACIVSKDLALTFKLVRLSLWNLKVLLLNK